VVAHEVSRARSSNEDCPQMTPQRSEIFRAFVRGTSIARIAESSGLSYGQAWSHLRGAVAGLDGKNPSALDAIRWQQYLMLMRIVDQVFAAFEQSAEEGVSEITSQTIESADDRGKLRLTGKSVTRSVRQNAGDVRYLEVGMKALAEIRDLFKIGAEAESKVGAAPNGSRLLDALVRSGSVRIQTRWSDPLDIRARS